MADLHTLPMAALPEGWECCGTLTWQRAVGPFDRRDLLNVSEHIGGFYAWITGETIGGSYPTRAEAITEVEAAYCNARIRR